MVKRCIIFAAVACVLSIGGAAHAAFSDVEVTADGVSATGGIGGFTPPASPFTGSIMDLYAEGTPGDAADTDADVYIKSWGVGGWATDGVTFTYFGVGLLVDLDLQVFAAGGEAGAAVEATLELYGAQGTLIDTETVVLTEALNTVGAITDVAPLSLTVRSPDGQVDGTNYDGTLTLTVIGQVTALTPRPPDPGPEPIPAPGAILLGSLGAGVVGWLRRRSAF